MSSSMCFTAQIPYQLMLFVIIAQAVFGAFFYKAYLSEILVILAWLVVIFGWLANGRIALVRNHSALIFIILSASYLFYSLFSGRELYWIARQSVFILYASTSYFGYVYYRRCKPDLRKYGYLLINIGLIMQAAAIYFFGASTREGEIGHSDYTAFLIALVGLSFVFSCNSGKFRKTIAAIAVFFFEYLLSGHFSFSAAMLCPMLLFYYFESNIFRPFMVLSVFVLVLIVLFIGDDLSDANALWRYMYWSGVLQQSWDHGYLLLGQGFGSSYMPESSSNYLAILAQVSNHENVEYQLMTVPPHNGMLTILIYFGAAGVIAFLCPIISEFYRLHKIRNRVSYSIAPFMACASMLPVLASNQFLEVPYSAIIFWLVYGMMIAAAKLPIILTIPTPSEVEMNTKLKFRL